MITVDLQGNLLVSRISPFVSLQDCLLAELAIMAVKKVKQLFPLTAKKGCLKNYDINVMWESSRAGNNMVTALSKKVPFTIIPLIFLTT